MVKSVFESKNIDYSEGKPVDVEDIEYNTSVYEYSMYDKEIEIALGKPKYLHADKYNIIFFSIYLIYNDELKSRIGIFEAKSDVLPQIVDDKTGNMDLSKGNIIIFITQKQFFKLLSRKINIEDTILKQEDGEEGEVEEVEQDNSEEKNVEEKQIEDEDDVLQINPNDKPVISKDTEVYVENLESKKPTLAEETKEDSLKYNEEFKKSSTNVWIQNFMKNQNFGLQDNEGGGDCLFAVIRDAFKDAGKITDVAKLRKIVSEELTQETFQHYRTLYLGFYGNLELIEKELTRLKGELNKKKKEMEISNKGEELRNIKEQITNIVEEHNKKLLERKTTTSNLNEFSFMSDIDTLEKFKEFVLTSSYWADTYTISILERKLNIKLIILSEEAYTDKALDSVMLCGQLNEESESTDFQPDFYIMCSYTGNHYKLITYKDKGIFGFNEIPYGIKALVINKCLEKNAGPFSTISEFKQMQDDLDIIISDTEEDDEDLLAQDLYDKDEVFMIHSKSFNKPKPGAGEGEKSKDPNQYDELLLKKNKEWRRMLDDSYKYPIVIDNKKWQTVKHYILGSQFKERNETIYNEFSLDDNDTSVVATNVDDAIKFSHENRKKIDPNFNSIKSNRKEEARERALREKFVNHIPFKNLLMGTKMAKITKFVRRNPAETDTTLMKIRKEL